MTFRYETLKAGDNPTATKQAPEEVLHRLIENKNLITGAKDLVSEFGDLSTIEQDLLTISSTILAADRASERGLREQYNRKISLEVVVHNVDRFYPRLLELRRIIAFLSKDLWAISLRQSTAPPIWGALDDRKCSGKSESGSVLLFSGGLDSLAAAVEFGAKEDLLLVSHVTRNRNTDEAQKKLASKLKKKKLVTAHVQVFVSSRNDTSTAFVHDVESSQRTRSIVFLTLGAIVARRRGRHKLIYMAENGQMAIHLPLSAARIGAFSTSTAHPQVLELMTSFLSSVMGVSLKLENPYVYQTKAQVVERINKSLPDGIALSTSCWRNARLPVHCGECVPCLIRRIAVEAHATDSTKYARNLFAEDIAALPDDDEGRRNFADIADFVMRFGTLNNQDLVMDFPELISDHFDSTKAIEMYRQFGKEARKVLSGYRHLRPFLL